MYVLLTPPYKISLSLLKFQEREFHLLFMLLTVYIYFILFLLSEAGSKGCAAAAHLQWPSDFLLLTVCKETDSVGCTCLRLHPEKGAMKRWRGHFLITPNPWQRQLKFKASKSWESLVKQGNSTHLFLTKCCRFSFLNRSSFSNWTWASCGQDDHSQFMWTRRHSIWKSSDRKQRHGSICEALV